ncbi:MAG: hypothetical protein IJR82_00355 [Bacilli bacterium]|nr:hypothetical protein [Bacilli bacterium]
MDSVEITIDNSQKKVDGIYYISGNSYYFLFTEKERDENDYIILKIVKVLQEVVNTPTGQNTTGNLVGVAITDDQEWKNVQKDITNIIDDKQNKKLESVRYLDINLLQKLIIKDSKVFRLKEEMYNKVFKVNNHNEDAGNLILDYKNRYYEETDKNRKLEEEIKILKEKLNQIKNIIG